MKRTMLWFSSYGWLILGVLLACLGCAGPDDLKGVADAGNRASGGEAGSGSKKIDLTAGVSQAGDVNNEAWKLALERNYSKAGDQFTTVSVASGGGEAAARAAISVDLALSTIRHQIAVLAQTEPTTPAIQAEIERLTKLATDREKEIRDGMARQQGGVTIGPVNQVVIQMQSGPESQPSAESIERAVSGALKAVGDLRAAKP